jgi:hypothetical protein
MTSEASIFNRQLTIRISPVEIERKKSGVAPDWGAPLALTTGIMLQAFFGVLLVTALVFLVVFFVAKATLGE